MEQMFTVSEAAKLLKVSEGTLRNWMSAGKVGFTHVGAAARFRESDLVSMVSLVPAKEPTASAPAPGKRSPKGRSSPRRVGCGPKSSGPLTGVRAIMERSKKRVSGVSGSGKGVAE
jgi:excisionase family DNA binding protein